jgi:GT2 family glycosyltransferase
MEKNECTIIIPTYFANQMLQNCIASILDKVASPKIYIYKNDIGWLRACNAAMLDTQNDIILLNDDTYVLTDIVREMQELAYSDDKIGIVGGKSLSPNQDSIINYGIYIAVDGNTAHKYFGQPRNSVKIEKQRAVEGSCMYIKRELINKIGIFDEIYTMGYRAEVDYAFRAREAGYTVMSTPKAEYVHFSSQTSGPLGIKNDTYDVFIKQWGQKLKLGKV